MAFQYNFYFSKYSYCIFIAVLNQMDNSLFTF